MRRLLGVPARALFALTLAPAPLLLSVSTAFALTAECGRPVGNDTRPSTNNALEVLSSAVGIAASCDDCTCDVDRSGDINARDALAVLQATLAGKTLEGCPACAVTRRIGRSGGTIRSADGLFELDFPPDALTTDTDITVAGVASANVADLDTNARGSAYTLEPSGLELERPTRATFLADAVFDTVTGYGTSLRDGLLIDEGHEAETLTAHHARTDYTTGVVAYTTEIEHFSTVFFEERGGDAVFVAGLPDVVATDRPFTATVLVDLDQRSGSRATSAKFTHLSRSPISMVRDADTDTAMSRLAGPHPGFGNAYQFVCTEPGDHTFEAEVVVSYDVSISRSIALRSSRTVIVEKMVQCVGPAEPVFLPVPVTRPASIDIHRLPVFGREATRGDFGDYLITVGGDGGSVGGVLRAADDDPNVPRSFEPAIDFIGQAEIPASAAVALAGLEGTRDDVWFSTGPIGYVMRFPGETASERARIIDFAMNAWTDSVRIGTQDDPAGEGLIATSPTAANVISVTHADAYNGYGGPRIRLPAHTFSGLDGRPVSTVGAGPDGPYLGVSDGGDGDGEIWIHDGRSMDTHVSVAGAAETGPLRIRYAAPLFAVVNNASDSITVGTWNGASDVSLVGHYDVGTHPTDVEIVESDLGFVVLTTSAVNRAVTVTVLDDAGMLLSQADVGLPETCRRPTHVRTLPGAPGGALITCTGSDGLLWLPRSALVAF